jgi:hypothetical protein
MKLEMHIFEQLPIHDTCWSIISGADNNVYIVSCGEYSSGLSGYLLRWNTQKKKLEYLVDIAESLGQAPDSRHASHCKVHYSLLSDLDGIIYGATHLSAPGKGERFYSPWNLWKDPVRGFPGSGLFAYDPRQDKVIFTDTICPHEGCRCLAIDQKRRIFFGITYPRNHFFWYDIEKRKQTDIGRIGNVNPQCVFTDSRGRAYTTTDYGQLIRFDVDKGDFEELDIRIPHPSYQDGLHTILYDVVQIPGANAVFGVPWSSDPHFFKYTFDERHGHGKIEDWGATAVEREPFRTTRIQTDHTGGLVMGRDGFLYYCANVPSTAWEKRQHVDNFTWIMRMDPKTGKKEQLKQIRFKDFTAWYVSRAVRDRAGVLYLADVGNTPGRLYRFTPDYSTAVKNKKEPANINIRNWG